MRPWVLLDVSYLAYRAWYTMGGLEYEGLATGIIYGVLEQMRRVCSLSRISSNRVLAFFDSRQSYRRRLFPDYKKPRQQSERTAEDWASFLELKKQVEVLRSEILPDVGIATYRQTGLEADDLIAKAAVHLNGTREEVGWIVSADGDLLQSISRRVALYNPGKEEHLTWSDVIRQKRIAPPQWAWVKCLVGCPSDSVPGIPGVGEKSAIDYLLGLLPPGSKKYRAIQDPSVIPLLDRNVQLVCLPHTRTRPIVLGEPDYRGGKGFFRVAERLGFQSLLSGPRRRGWDRFFAGCFGGPIVRRRGERK